MITFGERAVAATAAVRRIHDHARGIDAVNGLPYEASDPSLLRGLHATLLRSCRDAGKVFGTFLSGPGVLEARRRITLRMRAARLS